MVLDEAFPTSSPDPYDTPSSSDSYSNPDPDISTLPKPLPFLGAFFGYTSAYTLRLIRSRIMQRSQTVNRPLTPKESEAMAYHTAKSLAISSWGPPLGTIGGAARYYKTKQKYRFPFAGNQLKPDGWWDGERIRIMGQDVMKGLRAKQTVNILRATLYVTFGNVIVGLLVDGYAATVAIVGEMRDERLKDIMQAVRRQTAREMEGNSRQERQKRAVEVATGQGEKSASDLWEQHRGAIGADDASPTSASFDDASPTAAGFDYGDEAAKLSGNSGNGVVMGDEQMRSQEVRQQPRRNPAGNRAATFDVEKVERQPRSFDDDYDDASPTGGTGVANPGESAWQRIRRETASGGATSSPRSGRRPVRGSQQEQQEGSTAGDSFSFSSSEEERQLARDEAQKQFDERVDKERRGGDFSDGRRW
jgi:hypothetical protein